MLRRSLDAAKLGRAEKLDGFRRLDRFVRAVEERYAPQADFAATLAHEHAISPALDSRSVFDDRRKGSSGIRPKQLSLFAGE